MKLNNIYSAFEGEGIWIGTPTVFVRFQGCQICCQNCDSKETWNFKKGKELSQGQIAAEVFEKFPNIRRVSITGGNPLEQDHTKLIDLIHLLKLEGHKIVNIELPGVYDKENFKDNPDQFVKLLNITDQLSIDIKPPSTGRWNESLDTFVYQYHDILKSNILFKNKQQQVKMVISNTEDDYLALEETIETLERINYLHPFVITPCWNTGDKFEQMNWIDNLYTLVKKIESIKKLDIRIILQQHKVIYGSERQDI